MERGTILDKAKETINGARQDAYGNPEDSFSAIAGCGRPIPALISQPTTWP